MKIRALAATAAVAAVLSLIAPSLLSAQQVRQEHLESFRWRSVGPPGAGGRIIDIEVVGDFPHTIFVAAATGGLWRTTNNGVTFEPLFDNERTNSIGALAVHPRNPDVLWVGTGENNARNSVSWGDGVYKSTDGGASWVNVGLQDSHHIGDILIDPADPDTVYVAALGHFWGANEERGVYKTTDGGANWERILFVDTDTGVVDLAMDPQDPATLYAATYQVRRDGFSGGNPETMTGPGSGIHKTTDGGRTWKALGTGLPRSEKGRIGLAVSPTEPEVVYAIVQTATTVGPPRDPDLPPSPARPRRMEDGGVFRSEDRGETFRWVNSTNPRPFYYSQIRVDPNDADRVYVLGSSMSVSEDGGESFETVRMNVHVDHHDLWINPANSDHLVLGNDGGIYMSYDRGSSWDFLDQIALGQFYAIDVDMRDPYYIYGGVQDYMSWAGPSATRNGIGIVTSDWYKVMTGDGFQVRIDPSDPNIVYAESQGGGLIRHDQRTGQNTRIRPEAPDGEEDYRFNWDTPIHISTHDPSTLYMAGNVLLRSPDRGDSWQAISDDLTTFTRSRPDFRGGEPQKIGTASAFAESPLDESLLFVGTDDGNVWRTRDGGASWDDLTEFFPGLTGKRWVSRIVASRFDADRAYTTFDGHRSDDFAPHVYMTLDAGETWESIAAGIPDDEPVRVIREDAVNPDLLFVGTEFAAYASFDRGGTWLRLMHGMPTVAVADLVVHPRDGDLVAGTHGRSAYIMDIAPLQQLTPEIAAKDLHLFTVENAEAFRYRVYSDDQFLGEKRWVAENPPYGATISYLVGETAGAASGGEAEERAAAGGEARESTDDGPASDGAILRIADPEGNVIRELTGPGTPGLHRLQWDLRHGPLEPRGARGGGRGGGRGGAGGGGGRGGRGGGRAPLAEPGTYQVTLDLGGRIETTTVVVEPDRELNISEADRRVRWQTIQDLRPLIAQFGETTRNAGEVLEQLEAYRETTADTEELTDELRTSLDELIETARMAAFRLGRPSGTLSGVYSAIESSPFAPTDTQLRQIDEATAAFRQLQGEYAQSVDAAIDRFEVALDAAGIPRLTVRRIGGAGR